MIPAKAAMRRPPGSPLLLLLLLLLLGLMAPVLLPLLPVPGGRDSGGRTSVASSSDSGAAGGDGGSGGGEGGAPGGVRRRVATHAALLAALRDPDCTRIELLANITLSSVLRPWQGSPVALVGRNLTISGAPAAAGAHRAGWRDGDGQGSDEGSGEGIGSWPPLMSLDLAYLRDKVALAERVTLTFENLALLRSYAAWVPGVHFVTYAPGSTLRLRGAVRPLPACPQDLEWLRGVVRDHALPHGYLPPAALHPPSAGPFANALEVVARADCERRWPRPASCAGRGLAVARLAYEVPRQPDRRWAHAFVGVDEAFDSYFPCEATLPQRELERRGYPEAFGRHAERMARRARLAESAGPAAAGALAAAAAVFLSLVWWRRQQQQQGDRRRKERQRRSAESCGPRRAASGPEDSSRGVVDSAGSLGPGTGGSQAAPRDSSEASLAGLTCGVLIGAGSFGRVYRGELAGRVVAVKVLEVQRLADQRAVRSELAVNQLLRHPNVVRCIAWQINSLDTSDPEKPTGAQFQGLQQHGSRQSIGELFGGGSSGSGSAGASGGSSAEAAGGLHEREGGPAGAAQPRVWTQVLLLLEFCDRGSLHDAIVDGLMRPDAHAGRLPASPGQSSASLSSSSSLVQQQQQRPHSNMDSVLRVALDVAHGMQHLHQRNVCHGDLCAKNVLLCSDPDAGLLGVRAKIADFGLSRLLPQQSTHLSTLTCGTLTHMAPELLQSHRLRPACDVYSYGVLLWELVHLGLPAPPPDAPQELPAPPHSPPRPGGGGAGGPDSPPPPAPASQAPASPQGPDAGGRITRVFHHLGQASPWAIMRHVIGGGRPLFVAPVPGPYAELARRCWSADPAARPGFDEVVAVLEAATRERIGDGRRGDLVGSL